MRRREFITLAGGAAAAWPFTALSEQTPKLRTIGFLGAANLSAWRPWVAALVQRLHELGWIEGRTIAIEYRWAEGQEERYAAIAEEKRVSTDIQCFRSTTHRLNSWDDVHNSLDFKCGELQTECTSCYLSLTHL